MDTSSAARGSWARISSPNTSLPPSFSSRHSRAGSPRRWLRRVFSTAWKRLTQPGWPGSSGSLSMCA